MAPPGCPRETRDGVELPSYVGDLVNRPQFTPEARRPDPDLLLMGYQRAALTLNFIRSLCAGGFSDLRRPEYFDLKFFERNELPTGMRHEYARICREVSEGLHLLQSMGDRALDELARVMQPGRNVSFHCMLFPASKERDGFIGLKDFRGDLIRAFQAKGFIFHSETVIWKDPVTQMQRTKALGLLHKSVRENASMCRQGIPDYLITMRTPGDVIERVKHTHESYQIGRAHV